MTLLKQISAADIDVELPNPVDERALKDARRIVEEIRTGDEATLRNYGEKFGELNGGAPLFFAPSNLQEALQNLPKEQRQVLERTAKRIRSFAEAQRQCLQDLSTNVDGGQAGHTVEAIENAGCYAPGGRYPLPSSVLMTALTARVAGVKNVTVASPKPTQVTLAAAAVAEADGLLAIGGAHAIAALAYGTENTPRSGIIVGPGNKWVTAAKHIVSSVCAIDMLAGPSELVVFADASADPTVIAADLLAQAEHDVVARPILVSIDQTLIDAVNEALAQQLTDLPTASTAREALSIGFSVLAASVDEGIEICNQIAPEHLEVMLQNSETVAKRLSNYGGLFIGQQSAEVFGDYGVGPNHVLPTGGTARSTGGLSVLTFLRIRTWLQLDKNGLGFLSEDAAALARLEGLEAHARAAEYRK